MRVRSWVVAGAVVISGATWSLGSEALVVPGDRILGNLGEGGSDDLSFFVAAPSSLDVRGKLAKDLRATIRVVGPRGDEIGSAGPIEGRRAARPVIRHMALTQVGIYRILVDQTAGDGTYSLQFKLGKHPSRRIDMTTPPADGGALSIGADAVTIAPEGTSLASVNVQDAVVEVADRIDQVSKIADQSTSAIQRLNAGAAEATSARASLASEIADLADRVAALEGSPAGTAVGLRLIQAESGATVDTSKGSANGQNVWVLEAGTLFSTTIAAGSVKKLLRIRVSTSYVIDGNLSPGTNWNAVGPKDYATWATVDGVDQRLETESADNSVSAGTENQDLMGVPSALRAQRAVFTYQLNYVVTAEQVASGFDVIIKAGLIADDYSDSGQTGSHLLVNRVLVLGE